MNFYWVTKNGIFKPTLMIDGKTLATWSVKHKTKVSELTVKSFTKLSDEDFKILEKAVQNY